MLCLERVLEAFLAFLFGRPFRRLKERRKQKISVLGMPVVYEVRLAQTRIMRKRMQDGVRHRELVFRDSTSVTLSSLPSRTTEEPQLALLRYRTSGSNKQPWILFAFKHMKTKTRGIFLNVEWKCNISFLSSFWVRGPTNKPRFSSGTGQTDVPLQLFFSDI